MEVIRAFRNLDRHDQQRAPEVIEEEVRQLEPHLVRFREDLVRLEVVASQTSGKTRIQVSLRLQLPSGVIAAQEEGFVIEPVLRKAFADLRQRVDRHVRASSTSLNTNVPPAGAGSAPRCRPRGMRRKRTGANSSST